MTREDVQYAWEKIVEIGISNYDLLTTDQRIWFNIEPLTTNGIIDHYINHGAEHNYDTIKDLEFLEFFDIAELLKKVNSLFKNGEPPTDINERNDQINDWNGQYDILFNEIDEAYWDRNSALEKVLLNHINKTNIGN
jgi:hypothetical protein